jgi:hypothetical protein
MSQVHDQRGALGAGRWSMLPGVAVIIVLVFAHASGDATVVRRTAAGAS